MTAMQESTLALMSFLKIIWVGCFAYLYSLGGTEGFGKWIRRYCGSFWMGLGVFGFSQWAGNFHLWYLAYPVLLSASLHLGYGGEDGKTKLRKRFIYGMALGISALPLCFTSHLFVLFGLHCFLCVFSSVALGRYNPTSSARDEETLIALLSTITPLYLIGG